MDNEELIATEEDTLPEELAFEADAAEPDAEDLFQLELDGTVHTLPGALKGAFLRQADYTRKTQELADQRRALEAERAALAERRRGDDASARDWAHLAALDEQLAAFEAVDWHALAQAEPERAQALWAEFQDTQALREQYAYAVAHHEERGRLESAREAAERMAETGRKLREEIEGWSPETAAKLVEYAGAFGVTLEELAQAADPRLWKLLHKAWKADQASQNAAAAQAQAIRPAVLVAGAAAGSGGVRDELGTKEWMRRRNEQTRSAR